MRCVALLVVVAVAACTPDPDPPVRDAGSLTEPEPEGPLGVCNIFCEPGLRASWRLAQDCEVIDAGPNTECLTCNVCDWRERHYYDDGATCGSGEGHQRVQCP